jgi:hypothetical protein
MREGKEGRNTPNGVYYYIGKKAAKTNKIKMLYFIVNLINSEFHYGFM